jgi:pimeloyl-ACP methyl ester carboxylesterase
MTRLIALALTLAAIGAAPAGAHVRTTPESVPIPQLDWRDCDGGLECATAEVPRDYSRPRGPKVRLAVVRHPALDPEHRIGSLFMNPGGPGSSATQMVRELPPPVFGLLSKFDVVGFDPRGVGSSAPKIDCDEIEPFRAMTPDTLDVGALLADSRALAKSCLNRDPSFLASVNTGNTARDLDVMRAAVGDKKLTYLGLSAGAMIGATYASLFPGRARALALDSPVDSDVWLNDPIRTNHEQDASMESTLKRFLRSCTTHREACGFGGDDPETDFDELVGRLDAAPIDLGDGRRLDGQRVTRLVFELLYNRIEWPEVAQLLRAARDGDVATLREIDTDVIDNQRYELLYDAFNTYQFVERRFPRRLDAFLDEAEHDFTIAPHFALGAYELSADLFWPIEPRGVYYGPFRHAAGATPALIIASTHDPATPYAWAKRVVRDLGNARLLTFHGDGHGVLKQFEPCPVAAFVAYVEDLELPPAGASCTQSPGPWPAALAARRGGGVERR